MTFFGVESIAPGLFLPSDNSKAHGSALNLPLAPFSAKVVRWHGEQQFVINQSVH